MREPSGPHPTPPLVERESEPPFSARGLWRARKTIGAVLAALIGLLSSTGTIIYQIGERAAEERARDREAVARDHRMQESINVILQRSARHDAQFVETDERLDDHDTRVAVLRRDVDELARDIEETKRRTPATRAR